MKKAFKAAFPATVPVLLGYLFVGLAYGLLLKEAGYGALWAGFISMAVYAGSMQFVLTQFLAGGSSLIQVALVTLAVNCRHIFYGLSLVDKLPKKGLKKWYTVFALSDESYSLLCSQKAPAGVDEGKFYFAIALLDQLYWICGALLGALAGNLVFFNTTGIDFAMTALFLVICTEQWIEGRTHLPVFIGAGAGLLFLFAVGADNFLLPALLCITLALLIFRKPIENRQGGDGE